MMSYSIRRTSVNRSAAFVLSVLSLVLLSDPAFAADKSIEVGQQVPEFQLGGLDGVPVSYQKQIRGRTPLTLLFFMTTACSACYEELQEIDEFVIRNPGKVEVWCVMVDLRGLQTVVPFQKANSFRVRYLIDPKFSLPRMFGFSYTPSLAILDTRGVVLHKKGGYTPNERISDLIRTFLK
jgi:peroxiredoxin